LGKPVAALLAISSAGQTADLQIHQPLRGKANHLTQKFRIRALSHQRLQVHRIVGHRRSPLVEFRNPKLSEDLRWPPVNLTGRYSAG
jgi:hypothetical protein